MVPPSGIISLAKIMMKPTALISAIEISIRFIHEPASSTDRWFLGTILIRKQMTKNRPATGLTMSSN